MTEKAKDAVREEYDQLSACYEDRWRTYVDVTARETLRRAQLTRGAALLDVGCGSGVLLRGAAADGAKVAGIDLSLAMLAEARRNLGKRAWLVVADAERIPFRGATFDIAVSSSSLHFWPSPQRGLIEVRRVLRPNGRLVLTDWCDDFLACHFCDLFLRWRGRAQQRIYTAKQCDDLLREAGFIVTRIDKYKVSWLWGVMTAQASSPR